VPSGAGDRTGRGSRIWYHAPELCKLILKEYQSGESINEIRSWLNNNGMETPQGGSWNFSAVAGAIEQAGGKLRTRSEAAVARENIRRSEQLNRLGKKHKRKSGGNVVPGE
jgi:hypothetical protein